MNKNITITLAVCLISLFGYSQTNRQLLGNAPAEYHSRHIITKRHTTPLLNITPMSADANSTRTAKYVLEEDFSLFTLGSETTPDSNPVEDYETGDIPSNLTHIPGWYGDAVYQAGGTAYIGTSLADPNYPGVIETGSVNLTPNQGAFIVHFRARTTDGQNDFMNIISIDGTNLEAEEAPFNQTEITPEWNNYSVALAHGAKEGRVQIYPFASTILIDDIKIESKGLPSPTPMGITEFDGTQFTAHWSAVENSTKYLVTVYSELNGASDPLCIDKETTETSMHITGLSLDKTYYFSVKAANDQFTSCPTYPTMVRVTEVPAPDTPIISNITPTGFTASWNAVDNGEAYMPYISIVHQAKKDENCVLLETDFSQIISNQADTDPKPIASNYLDKKDYIDRADWIANHPYIITGALGFFEGNLQSPLLDLSLGNHSVTLESRMKGYDGLHNVTIQLRKDIHGQFTVLDSKVLPLSNEFTLQKVTLNHGQKDSYIIVLAEEDGYLFMDDLKVYQPLKANETIYIPLYTYETYETNYTVENFKREPGIKYGFAVSAAYRDPASYSFIMSKLSSYTIIPEYGTGISKHADNSANLQIDGSTLHINVSTNTEVCVYSTSGLALFKRHLTTGTTSIDLPERGVYIVRMDNNSYKIVY